MTTKQLQHLLGYLGYDTGGVDGLSGPKTEEAVSTFRAEYGLTMADQDILEKTLVMALAEGWERPQGVDGPDSGSEEADIPAWWAEIKYFTRSEFRCPCEKYCGGYPAEPEEALIRRMEALREHLGKAVIVVPKDGHSGGSGVRCKEYNATLSGSVANSKHLQGKAADFSAPGVTAAAIEAWLKAEQAAGRIAYWYKITTGSYHMEVG